MASTQPTVIPLYAGAVPNSKPAENKEKTEMRPGNIQWTMDVSIPTITRYDPPKELKNGASVVICPGGGYGGLADGHEGSQVAQKLNEIGVTAFVLKYRLPSDRIMIDPSIGPWEDAQQAIRLVRKNAAAWGLARNRVGIMGFSAGGHLAATAGVHFQEKADPNETDTTSVRPDFMALIYPVISFKDNLGHIGSRDNLIGKDPKKDRIWFFSNEDQVTFETPPTFIVHAADDFVVIVDNSITFYRACVRKVVPAEMHLYPKGGHGFGLINPTTKDRWFDRLTNWLDGLGALKK